MTGAPAARGERRGSPGLARLLDRAFWLGGGALLAVAVTFVAFDQARRASLRWVEHSRVVDRVAREALALALSRSAGVRAFLLTRDSVSLELDFSARAPLAAKLDSLVQLTADNPVQQRRAREVRAALEAWDREFATPALAEAATDPRSAPRDRLVGKREFDLLRVRFATFSGAETVLYGARRRREEQFATAALVAVLVELLAIVAALAALRRRAVAQATALAEQQEHLEEQAVELELHGEEAQELARELEASNEALRGNEARTQLMLESVRDYAILRTDPEGRVVSRNAAAAQLYGYPSEEIVGRHIAVFSPPDAAGAGGPHHELEAAAQAGRFEAEGWRVRKDGSRFWANVVVAPLRDPGGALVGFVKVTRDLTERREAEVALREQYEFLRTVLEATDDTVFAKDLRGRYVVANPATPAALGRPLAEIVGRTDDELFPPALAAELRANDARVLAEGTTVRAEESTVVGGEPRTFLSTKSVYRDALGRPAGIVGVSIDVTERRRSEDALAQANRELAATTYSIAHDLRSPLRALDGYSRILQLDHGERLGAEGTALLDRIRANSQRMGQLIDGILGLVRLGQADLQVARVDLSQLAHTVLDELRRADGTRRVEARVEPGLVAVGDPRLLTLVVQNLLDNAWKFTRGRDPATIEVGSRDEGGERVYFVRDNGAGFDPAYGGQLFRTFQRLHHANEFEGHGIGLAGVKRAVERHGGRVWAEGVEGRGATFSFTLGAVRAAPVERRAVPAPRAPAVPFAGPDSPTDHQ